MNDAIEKFIKKQPQERQAILKKMHVIIVGEDKSIVAGISKMMGKEMIMYNARGMMKYALSSVANHMSLHVLPIYGSPVLYKKYQALLPDATFQKGCINFKNEDEIPLNILTSLIADCSPIDLAAIREKLIAEKKSANKKK